MDKRVHLAYYNNKYKETVQFIHYMVRGVHLVHIKNKYKVKALYSTINTLNTHKCKGKVQFNAQYTHIVLKNAL